MLSKRYARRLLFAAFAAGVLAAVLAKASGVHLSRLVGWNEAERLMRTLDIAPGMSVADVGAGDGWLAVEVARRVGPGGQVFATEIDPRRLQQIRAAATREQLDHITVVEALERASGLPPACCEVIYLRYVYHHLTQPAAVNQSLAEALVPGGRLAIIDFEPRGLLRLVAAHGARVGGHGVHREDVLRELAAAGFRLEHREEHWGQIGYLFVFRREPG